MSFWLGLAAGALAGAAIMYGGLWWYFTRRWDL